MMHNFDPRRPAVPPPPSGRRALSPREAQVASLVARGLPTKSIAAQLGISAWTVATYLRRLFARFDVNTRAAMIARLFDEGLITPKNRV